MNDNVRQIFNMLGVEPNEKFKIEDKNCFWKIDEKLNLYYRQGHYDNCDDAYNAFVYGNSLIIDLINNPELIIKLPKEPKTKKLRDLTPEEWDKWKYENCGSGTCSGNCSECIFNKVCCNSSYVKCSWIYHKDLFSDKFLNQEIEVCE